MSRVPFFWRWVLSYLVLNLINAALHKLFGWAQASYEFYAIASLVLAIDAEKDAA